MKKKNLLLAFTALITLLSLNSCKKAKNDLVPLNKEETNTNVIDYIKSLGYRDSEIKDIGTDYLVNGDILFSKKSVIKSKKDSNSKLQVNQYGAQNFLGLNTNVVVRIDASMNGYINEINSAITQWNNVPNCRVKFSIYNGTGSYNTTIIVNNSLGSNVCGASYFPINGQPGNIVYINSSLISGNSFDQRQRTITHEFGHIIGLAHTNWFAVGEPNSGTHGNGSDYTITHIMGTPAGVDPVSLMNSGECGFGATVLSDYDKMAIQYVYPQNPPIAGSSPVFRYFYAAGNDHFYTTDYNELAQGSNAGYTFEGIAFFAFTTQVSGSAPVYRYFNSTVTDHFYTRNSATPGGYVLERIAFYAYPSAINGSIPVYRYLHSGAGVQTDHFYTKDQNEFYMGNLAGFVFEDIPFYAY